MLLFPPIAFITYVRILMTCNAGDVSKCMTTKHAQTVAESVLQVCQFAARDQRSEQMHQVRVHVRLQINTRRLDYASFDRTEDEHK